MDRLSGAEIGRMVRYHRKRARLTQEGLARVAEVGKTAVFDVEKGKVTVRLLTLLKLLKVLNIQLKFEGPLMGAFKGEVDEAR